MINHKDDIIRIVSVSKESEYSIDHPLGSICLHHKLRRALPPGIREDYDLLATGRQNEISKNRFSKLLDTTKEYSEQLVAQAKVIFSTTVSIAGPYLKRVKQLPVVIMDEATQTSEPASLIPLAAPGIKKIIFVGDEAQLSAFTRVKALEMSLFERTLKNGSIKKPFMLDTQYRMHPEISEFPRKEFYHGHLNDGVTAKDRELPGIKYPVYFWDHQGHNGAFESKIYSQGGEETGYSLVNRQEAQYISRIIENLIIDKQIEPDRIGVMTGYAGQRDLISSTLESNAVVNPNNYRVRISVDKEDIKTATSKGTSVHQVNGIIVATVDAFQGREKDFIVMSCVRSNSYGNIGFLKDKRRMNVALTRAKCSLIFSGNAACLKKGDATWKEYLEILEKKGYVQKGPLSY
ncbi:unnamed protein product [Ambrosiozyma monospora]|uniref:Unnamed protein product n=1 Tax=Ambrosiozyma monospora TaxID=43982 RepID=A0A9W6Z031_AMBMO|nr:unnamed protein product [Ambrosiozyma monospora]